MRRRLRFSLTGWIRLISCVKYTVHEISKLIRSMPAKSSLMTVIKKCEYAFAPLLADYSDTVNQIIVILLFNVRKVFRKNT
jgi:hypothetical protein